LFGGVSPTERIRRVAQTNIMTVIIKPRTEITVPKSIRRQAGIKPGDRVEFSVADGVINIRPKLSLDEAQDEREIRDPKALLGHNISI
jgi:AbrB family looped-hinge helix DNA binding protein